MSNTPLSIPELGDKFVDYRQEVWGNSFTWSWERPPNQVEWVVIHHSVTAHDATADDIALLHKARGWGGVGYHFIITKDGKVYYVGDVGTARANVLNKNEKVIGICLVGDFTKHLPSDEQIVSAHYLCKFFLNNMAVWPQLKTWEGSVVGHKELQATACPGSSWKGATDSMFERIKNKIPYSGPTEPSPDPLAECIKLNEEKSRELADLEKKLNNAENDLKNLRESEASLSLKLEESIEDEGICQVELESANNEYIDLEEKLSVCQSEKANYKKWYEASLKKSVDSVSFLKFIWLKIGKVFNGRK